MSEQVGFTLRGRNPDVLTCIANLSNDEVFTPPEFAGRMLDTVAAAWAADHGGASIWADPGVRFLDPFTKSGVFLREITKRLTEGLKNAIPDLQARVDHILTKQVFGIAITQLTSLLARRSLYCSKHANGEHSIAKSFNSDAGNVWFERVEHSWDGDKCGFCGASKKTLDRGEDMETHAYAFIHADDTKAQMRKIFGDDMQFDVIIGNPPYQINSDGNTRTIPIYQRFIDAAISLEPKYVVMVTPSRWFAGGLGLDDFRQRMLADRRIRIIVDYPNAGEVFPGVDIKGGVNYFLWDSQHQGDVQYSLVRGDDVYGPFARALNRHDILVRDPRAEEILEKVLDSGDPSIDSIVHTNNEFGIGTNFREYKNVPFKGAVRLHLVERLKRVVGYIRRDQVPRGNEWLDCWKVVVPKSGSDGGVTLPDPVLGKPLISSPGAAVTQTFVFFDADSETAARSIDSYLRTRFFRFLVSLRKINQHAPKPTYQWVPMQKWDRQWTDKALYKKYGLSQNQIDYIETVIKSMSAGGDDE